MGGTLRELRRHAEHVVNLVEGASGEHFGDLDGDGVSQNPAMTLGYSHTSTASALRSCRYRRTLMNKRSTQQFGWMRSRSFVGMQSLLLTRRCG